MRRGVGSFGRSVDEAAPASGAGSREGRLPTSNFCLNTSPWRWSDVAGDLFRGTKNLVKTILTCLTDSCLRNRSINRYYDPSTDQFLSVDPLVDQTGQPYVYINDNPLNATDPLGLKGNNGVKVTGKPPKNLGPVKVIILAGNYGGNLSLVGGSNITVEVHDNGNGAGWGPIAVGLQTVSLTEKDVWSSSRSMTKSGDAAFFNLSSAMASGMVIVSVKGAKSGVKTMTLLSYSLNIEVNSVDISDTVIVFSNSPVKVSWK